MRLAMPVVWSEQHRLHQPRAETWIGMRTPAVEQPARADAIRASLTDIGADVVEADPHDDTALLRVHDPSLLEFLSTIHDDWVAAGLPDDPGQPEVVPYIFSSQTNVSPSVPVGVAARPGYFAYDTMTPIGPGTWAAACGAADAALTAVDLVGSGVRAAYACCRPPGHHVTRATYGGSCYLNNAAIAAAAFDGRVAVLDIDAHHGNGTQDIFWDDGAVLTGSVHVDPGHGWFPHFLGFAEETAGGSNRNLPLPPGSGDEAWLEAVADLAGWARGVDALVVALGVDAAGGDPESPLEVTSAGFREAGRILGGLGVPTVIVQEGGYDLAAIGPLVREVLLGFEDAP